MILSKWNRLACLVLATGLALTSAGCGDGGSSSGAGTTETVASADGKEKLPSDLPGELPLYGDADVYNVSDADDGEWRFILMTPDTKTEVAKKLHDAFSKDGWTIQGEVDLGKAGGQVKAGNGKYDVRVVYTPNPKTRDTATPTMMLSYDVEPAA